MTRHVFLSYVRENTSDVARLARALESTGVPVWLDRERLLPGQRWRDAIREAIRAGDLFIAFFSRQYLDRDRSYMNEELTLAIEELRQRPTTRSWFIPVSLDGSAIPARSVGAGETIHDLHWIDLTTRWDRGVEVIASAVLGVASTSQATDAWDSSTTDSYDEDAGLIDAGDAFMQRMAAYGDARSRMIAAVLEFYGNAWSTGLRPVVPTAWREFAQKWNGVQNCFRSWSQAYAPISRQWLVRSTTR